MELLDFRYLTTKSFDFPSHGHVNATLTMVALAIRLADRMQARHFERPMKTLARQPELVAS